MRFIAGVIFIIIGLVMVISPELFYAITEGWKNTSRGEPSRLFKISARFGGALFCSVGFLAILSSFFIR